MDFREAFLRAVTSYCSRPEHETPFPMPAGDPELCVAAPFWYGRFNAETATQASLAFFRGQGKEGQRVIARKAIKIFKAVQNDPVFWDTFTEKMLSHANKEKQGPLYHANRYSSLAGGVLVQTLEGARTNRVSALELGHIAINSYEDLDKYQKGKVARKIVKAYFANLEKNGAK